MKRKTSVSIKNMKKSQSVGITIIITTIIFIFEAKKTTTASK